MTKPVTDFSFAHHAAAFDRHKQDSIPGYKEVLLPECIRQSRRFIQPDTNVYDIGCSTGDLLRRVYRANRKARAGVAYIGIDHEPAFQPLWRKGKTIEFILADAVAFPYEKASFATCLFTSQFVRPIDKSRLLRGIQDGLVEGGALIIGEKLLAETGRMQDALQSSYYEAKRAKFTADQILDKDRSLRGFMTCWTETELRAALNEAGFRELSQLFRSSFFAAYLALK